CQLAHAAGNGFVIELNIWKDLLVWFESHLRAGLCARADFPELAGLAPPLKLHVENLSIPAYLAFQPFREEVSNRSAYSMQTTAGPVGGVLIVLKLSAGPKSREDHLKGGNLRLRMYAHWNAAPVIDNAATAIGVNLDQDRVSMASHRLINGVVDNLVNQVM